MKMSEEQLNKWALVLHQARLGKTSIEKITKDLPELSNDDAYQIQAVGINLRLRDGEKTIAYKMGLTSKAKMLQVGLKNPIYGVLTNKMQVTGPSFNLDYSIHPKIEPEIAFKLKKDLKGNPSFDECLDAIEGVGIALEILDSRYIGFKYFSLPDVIADNASSSYFYLGALTTDPKSVDLTQIKLSLYENGSLREEAFSNAILGNPLESLKECVSLLNMSQKYLPKNTVILTGAATAAIELKAGQKIELKSSAPFETLSLKID